nr:hypothetical protein [Eubacterium sp.]
LLSLSDFEVTNLTPSDDEEDWQDKVVATDSEVGQDPMPTEYSEEEATEQGTVESLEYETDVLDFGDGDDDERRLAEGTPTGETETKEAMVYLPYGYDESKQYDVFYIMHGMSGTMYTFLGNGSSDGYFKLVLDHMIEEGLIKPIIVVAPTITSSYDSEIDRVNGLTVEVKNDLIPLVESMYSTYAENTSEEGLIASRDHRCFGGFSMGGCATWWNLWKNTGYFRYYIPNSMIVNPEEGLPVIDVPTEQMVESMRENGYSKDDFVVYCGTGDEDYTDYAVEEQITAFLNYSDMFVDTGDGGFGDGNLMFRVWEAHYHRYTQSFDYFYNALQIFFPGGDESE